MDIKPEAINTTSAGEVLVGGSGKLYRYSADGEELLMADSPHAAAIKANAESFRKQAIASLERMQGFGRNLASQIPIYEKFIQQLEDKKERSKQEDQVLESIRDLVDFRYIPEPESLEGDWLLAKLEVDRE